MICRLRRPLLLLLLSAGIIAATRITNASSLKAGLGPAPGEQEESRSESRELIFKLFNFILLAGGLAFVLRRPLSEFLKQRSDAIRNNLEEGRKALQASQAQLSAVEEKLRRLEEEIRAFKESAGREMAAERDRIRRETQEEAKRIIESVRVLAETARRAARLELRAYAVQQAVELAGRIIPERLDDSGRRRLVSQFVEGLDGSQRLKVESQK